jgi:hypothetical protein
MNTFSGLVGPTVGAPRPTEAAALAEVFSGLAFLPPPSDLERSSTASVTGGRLRYGYRLRLESDGDDEHRTPSRARDGLAVAQRYMAMVKVSFRRRRHSRMGDCDRLDVGRVRSMALCLVDRETLSCRAKDHAPKGEVDFNCDPHLTSRHVDL